MQRSIRKFVWAAAMAGTVLVAQVSIAEAEENANEDAQEAAVDGEASAQEEGVGQDQAADEEDVVVEEIVVVGTRSTGRSVTDSPVPIDVITGEDFEAIGNSADLTDNLRMLVPSYTATPATGDGSAFVRPTSLRGTAPDQTLVLVNGKRRHRSALVHFFAPAAGNGAHGVDVGMIPGIAIDQVEVLRDGAAAQYGSDAIAGVINFRMKEARRGGEIQLQYGQHYEGEDSLKGAANVGLPLGEDGFVNLSVEYLDNDALSRGVQRPDAQALIDGGLQGVGADAPFGDEPFAQTWGRPESKGARAFVNAGLSVSDSVHLYFFGNYAQTEGRYRFFYRDPNHSSLVALAAQGFTGLPAGYTPILDGDQTDLGLVGGLVTQLAGDATLDLSVGYGENDLDYFLNNTTNPSLTLVNNMPQRDFDVGAYRQEEINLNADFSKPLGEKFNLGLGAEFRQETYVAVTGEPNSFEGAGANGLKGIAPADAGDFKRENFAVYADVEHDVSEALLLQYALRFEDFSDFGSTLNWKLAARVSVSPSFTLRGAASTGFHAPTPGQANVSTTITTFDNVSGLQVEEGLVPSTSPLVAAAGGTALREETSLNFSAGFTTDIGERTTLTVDGYRIEVDDRIYRTGDIPNPIAPNRSFSFYTNALNVKHQGIDLVLTSDFDWSPSVNTNLILAFGYSKIEVVGQTQVSGVNPVSEGTIEDIENNYPNERFVLTTNTNFGEKWNLLLRGNYYGKHFDERGRIGAAIEPSFEVGATFYIDAELAVQVTEHVRLAVGAVNVFDSFVDEIGPPFSNRLSVGLQYPRRSAANYEGGSVYVKTIIGF